MIGKLKLNRPSPDNCISYDDHILYIDHLKVLEALRVLDLHHVLEVLRVLDLHHVLEVLDPLEIHHSPFTQSEGIHGTTYMVSGTTYMVSGTTYMVSGTTYMVSGTTYMTAYVCLYVHHQGMKSIFHTECPSYHYGLWHHQYQCTLYETCPPIKIPKSKTL